MEAKEKRVGVFMQLYRNEPTMHKAIQSVLEQTYTNFKLYILVSKVTQPIVAKYAEKDVRIEVIEGKPGESSYNYDKYIAEDGNAYITIIDADDWYEKQYIEELVLYAEKYHTDITACGNNFVDEQERKLGTRQHADMNWAVEDTAEVLISIYGFFRTMWGKLITSEIILNYKQEELPSSKEYGGYGGDTIFMFNLFQNNKKLGICSKVLYNYRISSTGGSYVLREGRLDSDVLLFHYVKDIVSRFGKWSEQQERFLYRVYGEAIKDTIRLILKQKCLEEKRAEMLVYIFKNDLTYNLLERDRKCRLDLPQVSLKKSYTETLNEMLFEDLNKCIITSKTVAAYLELFEIIYIKWKDKLSIEEFAIILKNREMLNALIEERFQDLFEYLLVLLNDVKLKEAQNCLLLLRRITANWLLKPLLQEKKFVLHYADLLRKVNQGKNEEAFSMLHDFFSIEELPYQADSIVEFWINLAALLENANEFVVGKKCKIELLFKKGKIQEAKQEYEDLRELGVNDIQMVQLEEWLCNAVE